jgi:hypothetical protein
MNEPAQDVSPSDSRASHSFRRGSRIRRSKVHAPVRPGPVVVLGVDVASLDAQLGEPLQPSSSVRASGEARSTDTSKWDDLLRGLRADARRGTGRPGVLARNPLEMRGLMAGARVGPVVVVLDVAGDLLPRLVDRLPLRKPGASLLELPEPNLMGGAPRPRHRSATSGWR